MKNIIYMTVQCIDVELQNMPANGFNFVTEILDKYRTMTTDELERIYNEYYGG